MGDVLKEVDEGCGFMVGFKEVFVDENFFGKRLDVFICEKFPNLTRNFVHKLFEQGAIHVNEGVVSKHYKVKIKDVVRIEFKDSEDLEVVAENIPLDIVYEDEDVVVVNKQKGMVVHPAPGNFNGTLVNALMHHCGGKLSKIGGDLRPGIVHRIDKNTSGLLVVAKTDEAYLNLSLQIKEHSVNRIYEAVVFGKFKNRKGVINFPIGRSERDRKKMAVNFKNGKWAVTEYFVFEEFSGFSRLILKLKTGRTHQIRVHMAYIGHPIVGDETYGQKRDVYGLKGQCLCAKSISFVHPKTFERLNFSCEIDPYFKNFLLNNRKNLEYCGDEIWSF